MINREFWDKARGFHGHECPGLAIGVKVCQAAVEKLGIDPALDEEIVCIAENDSCSVDAVQAILGCTMGKGNLLYKSRGKQAFTFVRRDSGKAMRFYLTAEHGGMERPRYQEYLLNAAVEEIFDCREVAVELPERARIFASVACEECGERTAEHLTRNQDGKRVCLDCYSEYSRGW